MGEVEVVEREFGELALNMGPQHPSTHGVLHLTLHLRGEVVVKAIPGIGYLHRGVEKLSESLGYDQLAPIYERDDYLGPTANSLAFVLAVEKMIGSEVPRRGAWIRTMLGELQRISSHLVWLGTLGLDLGGALGGGTTLYMYCFREREKILDFMEELTGTRFHTNMNMIGGARYDIEADGAAKARKLAAEMEGSLDELRSMTAKSGIFRARMRGIGVISKELALEVGVTGPVLRASGVGFDLRREHPYDAYGELEFDVPVRTAGDNEARVEVRLEEMAQSARMVRQVIDGLPEGPIANRKPLRNPKGTKVAAGEAYGAVESPRGELGFYIVADGSAYPYRVKINAPSFCNLQVVQHVAPGLLLADLIATLGSLDPVLGDIDR
jgi:NADH-quinone oxidoreductase subunit D